MNNQFYKKELDLIIRSNRLRKRNNYDNIVDMGSNDYLGLAANKKNNKKAFKLLLKPIIGSL